MPITLDAAEVFLVRIPLRKPFRFADAEVLHIDTVLVRIESGGVSGWGEVFPGNEPTLTASWSRGVFTCVRDCLLPRLGRGVVLDSAEAIDKRLAPIQGNRHAKAVVNLAYLDLVGKQTGKSLPKLIAGDAACDRVVVGRTLDRYDDHNKFLRDLAACLADGYSRVTLKMRPGWDLSMLHAVRSEFPTASLACDLEGALSLDKHSEILYRFDDFFPAFVEQPLAASDFVGHAMLQDAMRAPISLDESITTMQQAEMAVDLHSARVLCLKSGKMGGATTAANMALLARSADIDCYSGFEIGTAIGYRFALALGALPSCVLPTDYIPLDEWLTFDCTPLDTAPLIPEQIDGQRSIPLWSGGGIGFEPDVDSIREHTVDFAALPCNGSSENA